MNERTNHRSS